MDNESKYFLRKIIMDLVCLFVVGFPILLLYLFGQPYRRGFFCNDESLMHPFKDSTITSPMLYIVGLVVPIIVMMIIEYIHYRHSNEGGRAKKIFERKIHPWIWNCYKTIGVFGFAVASSHLTTDIAKYTIGRLRPHFFAVCKPDVECRDPKYQNVYIEDFQCTGPDKHRNKETRLSFPSGHSSFSAVTMVYLVIYLQARMTWRGSKLLRHFIQYLCLMVAWGTALSRISDYKHHWSDCLVGTAQGALVAVLVAVYVSDLFSNNKRLQLTISDDTETPPRQPAVVESNHVC